MQRCCIRVVAPVWGSPGVGRRGARQQVLDSMASAWAWPVSWVGWRGGKGLTRRGWAWWGWGGCSNTWRPGATQDPKHKWFKVRQGGWGGQGPGQACQHPNEHELLISTRVCVGAQREDGRRMGGGAMRMRRDDGAGLDESMGRDGRLGWPGAKAG